jgi:WXG100 family type VII secretion target
MPAVQIRIAYDEMGQAAKTFQKNADDIASVHQRIKAAQDKLADGDWIGKGADKFQGEMEDSINPSLKGLQQAMEEASKVSGDISKIMHEADEEASSTIVIIVG